MIMWLKAAIIAISAAVGVCSVYVFKMKHDNPIEETAEAVIKNETGLDVDLTPTSPEGQEDKKVDQKADSEQNK